jgi:hypothetical protein
VAAAPREVDLLISGAAEILPCTGDPADPTPGFGGGVAVDDGRIVAVGDIGHFRGRVTVDARACTVLPGFVDAHTHVVFGGSRVAEYAAVAASRPVPEGGTGRDRRHHAGDPLDRTGCLGRAGVGAARRDARCRQHDRRVQERGTA